MILASLIVMLVLPAAAQVHGPARYAGATGLPALTPSAIVPSVGPLTATALGEAGGTRVVVREGYDWAGYFDNTDAILLGPAFIATYNARELAIAIAHELEHARQNHLGVSGYFAQEREWAALSVEARVWVELGASFDEERWRTGPRMGARACALDRLSSCGLLRMASAQQRHDDRAGDD